MIPSKNASVIIKKWEGFKPKPYNDVAGNATIGYGYLMHMGAVNEADKKIVWTEEHASTMLEVDIIKIGQELNQIIKVPVTQNEFDSLICWTYNLGMESAISSSWLRELNKGNYKDVPRLMQLWDKAKVNGQLVEVEGLKNRRLDEVTLFIKQ